MRWLVLRSMTSTVWPLGLILMVIAVSLGWGLGCAPQIRPQIGVERIGEPYPPLSKDVRVKVYRRGEPDESYREVGKVTATCPVKHWVNGQNKRGRPICIDGLRQGARKLGAQAVVEVTSKRIRPPGSPETPWHIMSGVAVRLGR